MPEMINKEEEEEEEKGEKKEGVKHKHATTFG